MTLTFWVQTPSTICAIPDLRKETVIGCVSGVDTPVFHFKGDTGLDPGRLRSGCGRQWVCAYSGSPAVEG